MSDTTTPKSISHTIEFFDNDIRLDIFLRQHYSEISRSKIQQLITSGDVFVNGKTVKKNAKLKENDIVTLTDPTLFEERGEDAQIILNEMDLDILFEDEYLLIVNKPAGLVVHPGNGNPDHTLINGIYHYLKDTPGIPRLVHRLDKNTSGVIICGKNEQAHEAMSKLFTERTIYKGYLGICLGRYPDPNGIIEAPLGRSKVDPIKRTIRPDGRDSRTDYALIAHESGVSVMAYRLHTGRTHQIRVHSSFAGFPIVQDTFYGGEKERIKKLEPMERALAYKVYANIHRQALHARYLAFDHPYTGEHLTIIAPLHDDFKKALAPFNLSDDQLNVYETPLLDVIYK